LYCFKFTHYLLFISVTVTHEHSYCPKRIKVYIDIWMLVDSGNVHYAIVSEMCEYWKWTYWTQTGACHMGFVTRNYFPYFRA
jgi:hypothetical protein